MMLCQLSQPSPEAALLGSLCVRKPSSELDDHHKSRSAGHMAALHTAVGYTLIKRVCFEEQEPQGKAYTWILF